MLVHFLVVSIPYSLTKLRSMHIGKVAQINMATKRHDSYIALQNHTSATLQKDTTYVYNNMKQIISRI